MNTFLIIRKVFFVLFQIRKFITKFFGQVTCQKSKRNFAFDDIEGCRNWSELIEVGKEVINKKKVYEVKSNVDCEAIATIIYTSGTTGVPKGVMLTHKNIVSNVISATKKFPFDKSRNQTALSFLPLCHIFERTFIYGYLYNTISIYFAESLDTIGENLKEIKPNFMTAVPRLLEKVFDKIYSKGNNFKGIKKKLFFWAVEVGLKYDPNNKSDLIYNTKHWIANKLIFQNGKLHWEEIWRLYVLEVHHFSPD